MQMQSVQSINVFGCEKQPVTFPTMTPIKIWDWLGDRVVWFQWTDEEKEKNDNGCKVFGGINSFDAFQKFFDILYATEGLVFMRVKNLEDRKKMGVKMYDPYECIPWDFEEVYRDGVLVYGTHFKFIKGNEDVEDEFAEEGDEYVEEAEAVELWKKISVEEFFENVYQKANVREWFESHRKISEVEVDIC